MFAAHPFGWAVLFIRYLVKYKLEKQEKVYISRKIANNHFAFKVGSEL